MSRYIKPTHTVHPELLLLFAFTINRKKKSREEGLGETKNGESECSVRECVTLQAESQRNPAQPENTAGRGDLKASLFHRMGSKVNYCEFQ